MSIFLDSSDVEEIRKWMKLGVIDGVTTNPTILVKGRVKGGLEEIKRRSILIADIVKPHTVSVEVLTNDIDKMYKQAIEFSDWAKNIIIKIPFHGPNGELGNLKVIKDLEESDVTINCTAMMSAQQCMVATIVGARYVSLFGGRVNDMGYNCMEEIKKVRKFLDEFKCGRNTELIVGSTREAFNIVDWINAGADIVTTPPDLLEKSLVHPRTKETVQQFLDDAKRIIEKV